VKENEQKEFNTILRYLTLISQLGLVMAASVIICFFIGFFLDSKLNTNGLFITIFVLIGVFGGFWSVYKLIMKNDLLEDDDDTD
jgi:ATP synthase protein I